MIHIGIDQHKRYSQLHAINDNGEVVFNGRVNNSLEEFTQLRNLFSDEPIQSVVEASRTWVVYDLLEKLGFNPKVANPLKVKAIAEAQIKTDTIDAQTLTKLLKADIIPEVHVADKETRRVKNILRQRTWLVKNQTAIKNRIYSIIDRNHISCDIGVANIFGVHGRCFLDTVAKELSASESQLLQENIKLLDVIGLHVKAVNKLLKEELHLTEDIKICKSLPGIGEVFGPTIALEIWDVKRFSSQDKLAGYAGLSPTTYSSGGKTYHGKLFWQCNKLLRYAFCEAAWSAIRSSVYFRSFYARLKKRVGSQKAIVATARKLCEITWHCLKEKRPYEERVYKRRDFKEVKEKHFKVCQSRCSATSL